METFLKSIATQYYHKHNNELNQYTFVFPNRRASVFFRKYLCELTQKPIWSPQMMSISELIQKLAPLQAINTIALLFELYQVYREVSSSEESFDEFFAWGEIIASDFNDIDKYCIDAQQLFQNISDLKEIDSHYDYLSEEQIAAIRTFWSNFNPANTDNKERFLSTWRLLFPLYNGVRKSLHEQGKGYDGMLYRSLVDGIDRGDDLRQGTGIQQLVFCGFNALTTAEHRLFRHFHKLRCADFYWDYSDEFLNDPQNKAYQFIRENRLVFPSKYDIQETHSLIPKRVHMISVSSSTGMAQEAGMLLQSCCKNNKTLEETALVLADENLLLPCLYALPSEVESINITMGYPLKNSVIYQLINLLIDLHEKARYSKSGKVYYYFKQVLAVINHKMIKPLLSPEELLIGESIVSEKHIQVAPEFFANSPLLQILFTPCVLADQFSHYLELVIQTLELLSPQMLPLDREFNYHFFIHNQQLRDLITKHFISVERNTYGALLRKSMDQIIVPFEGEPLHGLQVLGVLETRNIDFKNLIITSMNEGVFPKHSQHPSFIPYNLRKGFDLPTPELQDSIFSYYFHRLISRAEQVWILYDSRSEGLNSGEASRYCHLLKYEYAPQFPNLIELHTRHVSNQPHLNIPSTFSVPKTAEIMLVLEQFKSGGIRNFSPSALNTYIDCSMHFYFKYLKNIYQQEEIKESIDSALLGTVFHHVLESIYAPMQGQTIHKNDLAALLKNKSKIKALVASSFLKCSNPNSKAHNEIRGRDYIGLNIIEKYVERTLHYDQEIAPFTYLEGEHKFCQSFTVSDSLQVSIKGSIDRMDEREQKIRIIDYKSGEDQLNASSMEVLFDPNANKRPKGMFQTLLYALMLRKEGVYLNEMQPHIYLLRDLFGNDFNSLLKIKGDFITNFDLVYEEFSLSLTTLFKNLYDPEIPFEQTKNKANCAYCEFKKICNR